MASIRVAAGYVVDTGAAYSPTLPGRPEADDPTLESLSESDHRRVLLDPGVHNLASKELEPTSGDGRRGGRTLAVGPL